VAPSSKKGFWNRALVLDTIRSLHRKGIPLHSVSLGKRCDARTLALIRKTTGVSTASGNSLMSMGAQFCGSWKAAVEEAVSIPLARAPHPGLPMKMKWPKARVVQALQAIHSKGIPLGVVGFTTKYRKRIEAVLRDELKIEWATAQALISAAKKRFGTWRAAVEYSGARLPRNHAPSVCPMIDGDTVIAMIRALRDAKLPLFYIDLRRRRWDGYEAFFESQKLPSLSGHRLLRVGERRFVSWGRALGVAGIHDSLAIKASPWAPEVVCEAIRMLAKEFPSLHWIDLFHLSRRKVGILLRARFGQEKTLKRFLIDAHRHFGGWRKAVAASGLDPRIFLKPRRRVRASNLSTLVPHVVEVHWDRDGSPVRTLHLGERPSDPEQELLHREFDEKIDHFLRNGVAPHLRAFAGDLVDEIMGKDADLGQAMSSARSKYLLVSDSEADELVDALKVLLVE